jgi:hypothetical protein
MSKDTRTRVDRRALKVLFDTYWSPAGWRDLKSPATAPEDFEYAKRAGVMFDTLPLTHSDIVERAITAVHGIERQAVADASIASLASRRLEIRSALGSFAVLQHFPQHPAPSEREYCSVCGEYNRPDQRDLNILNFERFKWGGVRHCQPLYASMDLHLFQELPRVALVGADVAVFKDLLTVIEVAPSKTSSASLEKHLAKALKSNKSERDIVVAILGLSGILATAEHPGFTHRFVQWSEREEPDRHFVDMAYPACWWQRSDGINQEALAYWFGHVL